MEEYNDIVFVLVLMGVVVVFSMVNKKKK